MKSYILILLSTLFFSSCLQTRYITEQYIKTKVENHIEGEISSIKAYSIYKGASTNGKSYMEMTGYKYKDKKGLVIGADKYYLARPKYQGERFIIPEIKYVELSLEQCQKLIDNVKLLKDELKSEKTMFNEEVYQDYTVSKNLFISFKKSKGQSAFKNLNVWLDGDKFIISTSLFIKVINKLINY